jgi:hypothetical protein
MKKRGFATVIQFLSPLDICNSPNLYVVSPIEQVAKVAIHRVYNVTHYNLITTLSQLLFNYYATPL